MTGRRISVVAIVAGAGLLSPPVVAESFRTLELRSQAGEASVAERSAGIDMDQAIVRVRQSTEGHVLDARAHDEDERRVYVVKILTPDGHVRLVPVDARTGELLLER